MQERHRVSLNAVRVFVIVARTGSLTAAGAALGVTSGAVSHQLKKLEDELGVSFFRRGNSTVSLTDVGQRFYQEVAPAIGLIERSADALYRDETGFGWKLVLREVSPPSRTLMSASAISVQGKRPKDRNSLLAT
jgi:DNA-binding transcriptional LysR family regulator